MTSAAFSYPKPLKRDFSPKMRIPVVSTAITFAFTLAVHCSRQSTAAYDEIREGEVSAIRPSRYFPADNKSAETGSDDTRPARYFSRGPLGDEGGMVFREQLPSSEYYSPSNYSVEGFHRLVEGVNVYIRTEVDRVERYGAEVGWLRQEMQIHERQIQELREVIMVVFAAWGAGFEFPPTTGLRISSWPSCPKPYSSIVDLGS